MKVVEFYFDAISPYAYLAWTQLGALKKEFPFTLRAEPVLLAALLNFHGQKGPAEIPAKRAYTLKDVLRWAKIYGVSLKGPPTHPFNPLLALRCAMAIPSGEVRNQFSGLLLEGPWGRGLDVSDAKVLRSLLTEAGADAESILSAAESVPVKDALKANGQKAIEKGIFGVPTFIVDREFYWGNDRLPFLRDYLAGGAPQDEKNIMKLLERPVSATR